MSAYRRVAGRAPHGHRARDAAVPEPPPAATSPSQKEQPT
jgi:hypothetical protein